jgi:hypothetical protein
MASYSAISVVCEAVLLLLRNNYEPQEFNNELEFKVYLARDFLAPMPTGVSLFLYRILPNGSHRTPNGRIGPNGQYYRSQLPIDLHFLLTAWGKEASLQHTIAGWMMRILEDMPILPASLLNSIASDVFRPDETVELCLSEMTTEEMIHIWEAFIENGYHLSIPYVARNVRIESNVLMTGKQSIQKRTFEYKKHGD